MRHPSAGKSGRWPAPACAAGALNALLMMQSGSSVSPSSVIISASAPQNGHGSHLMLFNQVVHVIPRIFGAEA